MVLLVEGERVVGAPKPLLLQKLLPPRPVAVGAVAVGVPQQQRHHQDYFYRNLHSMHDVPPAPHLVFSCGRTVVSLTCLPYYL